MDEGKAQILTKKKLKELLEQVDSEEKLDTEVESVLLELADDFIANVTKFACQMARHRQAETLEVKDIQLVLETMYNIRVPGFGNEDKIIRKATAVQGHQQRLAQVKKAIASDTAEKDKEKNVRKQSDRM